MADELGSLTLELKSSKDLNDALQIINKAGGKSVNVRVITTTDKQGNITPAALQYQGRNVGTIQQSLAQGLPGRQSVAKESTGVDSVQGWGAKLNQVFSKKRMIDLNRNLFMMQMASLGVAFSFQSLQNQVLGIFSGLSDLGEMISAGALSTAYASAATGGTGGDILGTMGVNPADIVKAWLGFQAITNTITTLTNGLATKVLTPAAVSAILSVIDKIASELAKPEVVKAIQDIILAVLQAILQMVPLLPSLAAIVVLLSDAGLLGVLVGLVLIAPYLLSFMALLGFGFQAIILIAPSLLTLLAGVEAILGGTLLATLGAIILVVGGVLIIFDFLINLFEEIGEHGFTLEAVFQALGNTLADVINFIISAIKTLTFGSVNLDSMKWADGNNRAPLETTTTNNYYNYGNLTKNSDVKWNTLGGGVR